MGSLIANFIQFSSGIAKFFISAGWIGQQTMCALTFVVLLIFPHFLSRLTNAEVTRTFSL